MKKLCILLATAFVLSAAWTAPTRAENANDCADGSITVVNNTTDSTGNSTPLYVSYKVDNGGYLTSTTITPGYIDPNSTVWNIPATQATTKGTMHFGNNQGFGTFSFTNVLAGCDVQRNPSSGNGLTVKSSKNGHKITFTVTGTPSNPSTSNSSH